MFIIYISGKFLSILFSAASRGECHDAHHINQTNLLKLNGPLYWSTNCWWYSVCVLSSVIVHLYELH